MTKLEEAFQELWKTEFKDTEKSEGCLKKESERDIAWKYFLKGVEYFCSKVEEIK